MVVSNTELQKASFIGGNGLYSLDVLGLKDMLTGEPKNDAEIYQSIGTFQLNCLGAINGSKPICNGIYSKFTSLNEAISNLERAVELDPDLDAARINLGIAYKDRGELGKAVAQYTQVLLRDPDHLRAHLNLGAVDCLRGDYDKGIREFIHCVRINLTYKPAWQNIIAAQKRKWRKRFSKE